MRRAEVDAGQLAGITSEERSEIKALKKEGTELRPAKEILESASVLFAAELERPQRFL